MSFLHRDLGFFFCLGDWQRRAILRRGGGGRWRGCWGGLGGGVFEDELFFRAFGRLGYGVVLREGGGWNQKVDERADKGVFFRDEHGISWVEWL